MDREKFEKDAVNLGFADDINNLEKAEDDFEQVVKEGIKKDAAIRMLLSRLKDKLDAEAAIPTKHGEKQKLSLIQQVLEKRQLAEAKRAGSQTQELMQIKHVDDNNDDNFDDVQLVEHSDTGYKIDLMPDVCMDNPELRRQRILRQRKRMSSGNIQWTVYPELLFMVTTFMNIIVFSYLFVMALTAGAWKSSIDSIVESDSYHDSMTGVATDELGIILAILCFSNLLNCYIGCVVARKGMKMMLLINIGCEGLVVLCEFVVGFFVFYFGSCDVGEFRVKLSKHFQIVFDGDGKDTSSTRESYMKINALQRAFDCCGVETWKEYFHNQNLTKQNAKITMMGYDNEPIYIPKACCNPWWQRNTYCASTVHTWPMATYHDLNTVESRISRRGCVNEVKFFCDRMIDMLGIGIMYISLGHFILFLFAMLSVYLQVRIINAMKRAGALKAQELEELSMATIDISSGDDLEFTTSQPKLRTHN